MFRIYATTIGPLLLALSTLALYWLWRERKKVFGRFNKWLSGTFTCKNCGRVDHLMTFGYGETICPNCYNGEDKFIFFDRSYWLNRLLDKFSTSPDIQRIVDRTSYFRRGDQTKG